METARVQTLLNQLAITGNYKGFYYLCDAIQLASEHPEMLSSITKLLYPAVAERARVPTYCVERDMRNVLNVCWERGLSQRIQILEGGHRLRKPVLGKFIDLAASHLVHHMEQIS